MGATPSDHPWRLALVVPSLAGGRVSWAGEKP